MVSQQLSRASPAEGFSIARQVMGDVAAYYLANGGPTAARAHVENVANELKIYPDCHEAYLDTMAMIAEAEHTERQKAEELHQQQQQALIKSMMDVVKPDKKAKKSSAGKHSQRNAHDGELPPKLSSEKAMRIWKILIDAGIVDKDYQPIKLSRTMKACLANEIIMRLSSETEKLLGLTEKWKPFETLWNITGLKSDNYKGTGQNNTTAFKKRLELLLTDI
jgi:hypothetical protein